MRRLREATPYPFGPRRGGVWLLKFCCFVAAVLAPAVVLLAWADLERREPARVRYTEYVSPPLDASGTHYAFRYPSHWRPYDSWPVSADETLMLTSPDTGPLNRWLAARGSRLTPPHASAWLLIVKADWVRPTRIPEESEGDREGGSYGIERTRLFPSPTGDCLAQFNIGIAWNDHDPSPQAIAAVKRKFDPVSREFFQSFRFVTGPGGAARARTAPRGP